MMKREFEFRQLIREDETMRGGKCDDNIYHDRKLLG